VHSHSQHPSKCIRHPISKFSKYQTFCLKTAYSVVSWPYIRLNTKHNLPPYALHLPKVSSITRVKINRMVIKEEDEEEEEEEEGEEDEKILWSTFHKVYNTKRHLYKPQLHFKIKRLIVKMRGSFIYKTTHSLVTTGVLISP